jgi:hypothetical protein
VTAYCSDKVSFSLKMLIGYVPKADIACTHGRIYSVIYFYQKAGTLGQTNRQHLFVAKEGKTF